MTGIGYALLGLLGFLALKMFGKSGSSVPNKPGSAASPIDPATGAKIIDTSSFMGPQNPQARIPATDVGGRHWCPYPFTLYKDQADGKFYCYNEQAPIATTPENDPSQIVAGSFLSMLPPVEVTADAPVITQSEYHSPAGIPDTSVTAAGDQSGLQPGLTFLPTGITIT